MTCSGQTAPVVPEKTTRLISLSVPNTCWRFAKEAYECAIPCI